MTTDILNLLLADDDIDDCLFFREALEELPVAATLTIVKDGVELMELLHKKGNPFPHVLYLDLNMPRKNGYECLSEIRGSEKLKKLPVVIYSTSFDQQVANMLHDLGASYYMRKPAEFTNIKNIILQSLHLISELNDEQPSKENFVINSK